MNLSMSIFRSPVIALMPDITHKQDRSKSNSIINFMGGIGAVIAYFVGSILWDKNPAFPFYLAAILIIISFVIIFLCIKEKRDFIEYEAPEEKVDFIKSLKQGLKDKNTRYLLFAIPAGIIGTKLGKQKTIQNGIQC